jgi:ABC-type glycerol-3-phosphate transport system substrate-binding protein
MKKLLAILVLLVLAAGYTACGGGGYSSGPTAPTYMTPTPGTGPVPTPTPGGGGY